jgi:predicted GIY-YIG superfamily endonuclease
MGTHTLYGIMDGDLMIYVGVARRLSSRQWLHRRDAERRLLHPLYQLMRERAGEGRPVTFVALAEFPDRHTAIEAERDLIAQHGMAEDGGPLLNERRSGIGPAGFSKAALERVREGTRQALASPDAREGLRQRQAQQMAADPDYAAKRSNKMKAHWSDPVYRDRELTRQHSAEVQAKRAAEMKRRWADPAFREKMARRRPKTWTDEERATHGDKCRVAHARRHQDE